MRTVLIFFTFASTTVAENDCIETDMDVGGGSNECGYMPIVKIIGAPGQTGWDWYGGYLAIANSAADLDSPEKCQALCEENVDCKYWAWNAPDPAADCTLKADYTAAQHANTTDGKCDPMYEAIAYAGSAGPKVCPSCHKENMDVGGGANECGYMPIVKIIGAPGQTGWDWYGGYLAIANSAADLDSAEKCQALCAANVDCKYWYWSAPDPAADCTLKADYTAAQHAGTADGKCDPVYEAMSDAVGFAGPKTCSANAFSMTCGAMKTHYKTQECCRSPMKMVPKPA